MDDDIQIWDSWLRIHFPRDLLIYSKRYKTENGGDTSKLFLWLRGEGRDVERGEGRMEGRREGGKNEGEREKEKNQ